MFIAVRTGLEPATPCVTGMYSNQAELPHQNFFFLTGEECSRSSFELLATVGLSPCLRVQSERFPFPPNFSAKKITQMMHFFEKMRNDPTNKGYKQEKSSRALQPGCRYFIFNKTQV